MIFVCVYLAYYFTLTSIYDDISLFISSLSLLLHCMFFVLRLHMTFLHSSYQLSKYLLIFYAIICIISFSSFILYVLIVQNLVSISIFKDKESMIETILFFCSELLRLLILCSVSLQFIQKLILLGLKHYSPTNYEMQTVNLVNKTKRKYAITTSTSKY